MDLTPTVVSRGGTDLTWLRSDHGISSGLVRTLDITKFTSGVHYDATTKVLKSGIGLAIVTATSLYGPYDTTAADGRQLVLDSFMLFEEGLLLPDGALSAKVAVAVTRHAIINQPLLPIVAQRLAGASNVAAATTGGQFVFES